MMKKSFLLTYIILLILVFSCIPAMGRNNSDSLLRIIDNELAKKDVYIDQRKEKISATLQDLHKADLNDNDRYNVLRTLFSLYHTFDLDSALKIAQMRLDIAGNLNDTDKIISAKLNVAESSIALGSYISARDLLDSIPRASMKDYHRYYACQLYSKLYHNLGLSDATPSKRKRYKTMERIYLDSLAMFSSSGSKTSSRSLITKAEETRNTGNNETAKKLLGEAVLMDIRDGRRDMESLMQLANILCIEGDYKRSYKYITTALEAAEAAGAQSRTAEILQAASIIEKAHNAMIRQSVKRLHIAIIINALLSILTIAALVYALFQLRAKNRVAKALKESNIKLAEAGKMKEIHISNLFNTYSHHIGQIKSLRKQCLQLMKAGNMQNLERILSSANMENMELQNMYANFDEIFLSMYPRFIDDYNSRVEDEFRISPASKSLTPELRVLALITLGITDSGSIARMLQYSPQTIYNYRSRLKSRLKEEANEHL